MTKLYRASSSIADFRKATFSFWFRIPASTAADTAINRTGYLGAIGSDGVGKFSNGTTTPFSWMGGLELLAFGRAASFNAYSSIWVGKNDDFLKRSVTTSDAGTFTVGGSSAYNVGAAFACGDGPDDDTLSSANTWVCDYDGLGTAIRWFGRCKVFGHQANMNTALKYDTWYHLYIAADLDAQDIFGDWPPVFFGNSRVDLTSIVTRARMVEIYLNGTRIHGLYLAWADDTGSFDTTFPFTLHSDIPAVSPPLDVVSAGLPIGIPTFAHVDTESHGAVPITYNPRVSYAYFQAWFGKYINPAVNLNRFAVVEGGLLVPAPVTAAANAFGTPDIWFVRDKKSGSKFETNRGSAGAFSVIGTLPSDFSPGPSVKP